jgi:hypothetical protein
MHTALEKSMKEKEVEAEAEDETVVMIGTSMAMPEMNGMVDLGIRLRLRVLVEMGIVVGFLFLCAGVISC